MGQHAYRNGFDVTLQEQMLRKPLSWRRPQTIFVNSMSDLFHEQVPLDYIRRVFDVMKEANWHRFQVLTKRAARLEDLAPLLEWPPNVWMGVSVEDERVTQRIDHLRKVPAAVRFLSLEPLIGPLPKLNLKGIHWAIVGGESGPGCRPMEAAWVRSIRDQCRKQEVLFFFKQWGGVNKKAAGRMLDGKTYDQMPGGSLSKLDKSDSAAAPKQRRIFED
jgi:protein gp37